MTPYQISAILNNLNAEVTIFRTNYSYAEPCERWGCSITLEQSGTSLKVKGKGFDLNEALSTAYDNLSPLISTPAIASALCLPALSAPIDLESLHPGAAE